jgi:hypothetical protein
VVLNVLAICSIRRGYEVPGPDLLIAPLQVIAAAAAGISALAVQRAYGSVSPPEIRHRLTEALEYLQAMDDHP